ERGDEDQRRDLLGPVLAQELAPERRALAVAGSRLTQEALDLGRQLARILETAKDAVASHRDRAALLGHDQAQRVGELGEPQGGAGARSPAGERLEVGRERKMRGEPRPPVTLEDHGAVMAR